MKHGLLFGVILLSFTQCRDVPKAEPADATDGKEAELVHNEALAKSLAMEVQATLGKTLQQHLKQEGVAGAISYCNEKALPITDSISRKHGVQIQRITDKPRNSVNEASALEIEIMSRVRDSLKIGANPGGLTSDGESEIAYYFPIVTAPLCLNCHGTPGEEINLEDLNTITSFYPEDKAIEYNSNELRGLWKVTFNTKSNQ